MQPVFELSLANILPPATVLTMVSGVWSIYVFLHLLPMLQLDMPAEHADSEVAFRGKIQLLISQVLAGLMMVCFLRASLTPPGSVPEAVEWRFGAFKDPNMTKEVKSANGERRRCKHCLIYKPDRCHHCRICKCCILKMDHHCPWIMNCVGFRNHKYFSLLVVYALLSCMFIGGTTLESLFQSVQKDMPVSHRFLLMLCFVTTAFMGGLLILFTGFHAMLMMRGLTTIEFCEKQTMVASPHAGKGSK
ncbi:zdhhc15 [Symbiodinium pilosum]|uniref:Palmitoyltransferase n=1 Tax=Symbiodinium pilosum TaxID=2952 RepID=A0A812TBL9_SYMPI|nr:zdhhc15 [Symbiodinium pilosum]